MVGTVNGLLAAGRQSEAEKLLVAELSTNEKSRRNLELLFYYGALLRSRFLVEQADRVFSYLAGQGRTGLYPDISRLLLALDKRADVDANMSELEAAVDRNPDNQMLRWMLAVECRTFAYDKNSPELYNRDNEGVRQFQIILRDWKPGPVLVHQTLANLLDDQYEHGEALPHRLIAAREEPTYWSYQGLWLTLFDLGRYAEAKIAIERAIGYEHAPPQYQDYLAQTISRLISAPCR